MSSNPIYQRRKRMNAVMMAVSTLALAFGLFWLLWIVGVLLWEGAGALRPSLFTQMTPPPGGDGGLANAIVGSILMAGAGTLIGTPVGILAGTYLAEYGRRGWLAPATRFINDVLLSAPSIVIGLFVYAVYVSRVKHFSGWAGAFALAIIVIPVVARIAGETAPLLFTALNNQFWSSDMGKPMANLPVVIFQFAMSPYDDWHRLAWGGAALITLLVLGINISARVIFKK